MPTPNKIFALQSQQDEGGLLHSFGRLQKADYLPYDEKYLIIFSHNVTKLIITHCYKSGHYMMETN